MTADVLAFRRRRRSPTMRRGLMNRLGSALRSLLRSAGLVALGLVALLAGTNVFADFDLLEQIGFPRAEAEWTGAAHFSDCRDRMQAMCVVDGDTIRIDGVKVRLVEIDAPEIYGPGCQSERELGEAAAERLRKLLNTGTVTLHRQDTRNHDRYGRQLRVVRVDGRGVGGVLIRDGLARPWGGRKKSWC